MSGLASVLLLWAIDLTINTMKRSKSPWWRTAAHGMETACEMVTDAFVVALTGSIARGDF